MNVELNIFSLTSDSDVEALKILLKYFNVNSTNENGDTPLHIASASGNIKIVKLLLENKADKDIRNIKGNTPLLLALENNHKECVNLLIGNTSRYEKLQLINTSITVMMTLMCLYNVIRK